MVAGTGVIHIAKGALEQHGMPQIQGSLNALNAQLGRRIIGKVQEKWEGGRRIAEKSLDGLDAGECQDKALSRPSVPKEEQIWLFLEFPIL
jgi:hypothetical protein